MCGIFGAQLKSKTSKDVARLAMAKIKLLGLYNQSRGKDSCGLSVDRTIVKGVNAIKHWDDFIEKTILPSPTNDFTIIGHTRASTRGSHSEENAHPFLVKDHLVGAHNGNIQNIDTLLKKYDLKPADYNVDSQGLYALIEQEGFSILNEYVGYAALAFKYLDDPNTLYLYHGASKQVKSGKPIEERPLFFLETSEGVYFSSLAEALDAIQEDDSNEVLCLNYNNVFQIKNGEFTGKTWGVDREENNVTVYTASSAGNAPRASDNRSSTGTSTLSPIRANVTKGAGDAAAQEPMVLRETLPPRATSNFGEHFIYFHNGRYWEYRRTICHGIYHVFEKGIICKDDYPAVGSKPYYFYRGVMLKGEPEYQSLLAAEKNDNAFMHNARMNFAACISRFAKQPVTNLKGEAVGLAPYHGSAWYLDDTRFNASFTPKWAGRHYLFNGGFLREIKSSHKESVFHNEYTSAEMELSIFIKGGLLGVKGGTPEADPFPPYDRGSQGSGAIPGSSASLHSIASKFRGSEDNPDYHPGRDRPQESENSEELDYFYEIRFESFKEAMDLLGGFETAALKRYVRETLEENTSIDVTDREVQIGVCDIIKTAVDTKQTFLELCESEEDRYKLKSAYEKVLDENTEAIARLTNTSITERDIQFMTDAYADDVIQTVLEMENNNEMNATDIKGVLEKGVGNLKQMLEDAHNLAGDVESDLAQDTAAAMYKGIATLQGNLAAVADKYNYRDLATQIKALNSKSK
jgi:hypothetical protein